MYWCPVSIVPTCTNPTYVARKLVCGLAASTYLYCFTEDIYILEVYILALTWDLDVTCLRGIHEVMYPFSGDTLWWRYSIYPCLDLEHIIKDRLLPNHLQFSHCYNCVGYIISSHLPFADSYCDNCHQCNQRNGN